MRSRRDRGNGCSPLDRSCGNASGPWQQVKKIRRVDRQTMRVAAIPLIWLIAMVTIGCLPSHHSPAATPAATEPRLARIDRVATVAPAALAHVTTFAFNALVVPLLDDAEPPRFADPRQPLLCAEETEVRVDGQSLVPGSPVPSGAFTLQWDLRMYCPFGPDDALLDGRVNVLVFRDDERGMDILVQPPLAHVVRGERSALVAKVEASHRAAARYR